MTRASLDKDPRDVAAMFDDVAGKYDLTNDVLSLGQDRLWRRAVLKAVDARPGETVFKTTTARWFYKLFAKLATIDLTAQAGDFRLMDRRALDVLLAMPERNRFLRGMSVWVGFTQTAVPFVREPRAAGETKYTLRKMLRFSFDAITSFSYAPLQWATLLGFICAALAFLGIPLTIIARYTNIYSRGVPSVILIVLLLGGIQLICIGIIGEYVGRIYDEVKHRPLYVVRDRINVEAPEPVERT